MASKKTITPDPIVVLNDTYQVKLDPRCFILQKKISSDDKELSKEEQKEGMKNLGYYSTWEYWGSYLIKEITREKAKVSKEDKISLTNFINIVQESNKEVSKMFEQIDNETKMKKKSK